MLISTVGYHKYAQEKYIARMVNTNNLQPEEEFSQEVQASLISVSRVYLFGQICMACQTSVLIAKHDTNANNQSIH
jgi:hypothetical protein